MGVVAEPRGVGAVGPRRAAPVRAIRRLWPYLAFLGLCVVTLAWVEDSQKGVLTIASAHRAVLAYVLAWRVADRAEEVLDRLAQICLLGLGLVAVLLLAVQILGGLPGLEVSVRPMAISLAVMFVVATINAPSWRRTLLIGVAVVAIAGLTGSRMSSAVLMVLLLCSPSLAVSLQWRVAVALLAVLLLLQISQTEAFKTRFFFNSDATLADVLTLSPKLDTAGRREAWPALIKACSDAPITGHGVGASAQIGETPPLAMASASPTTTTSAPIATRGCWAPSSSGGSSSPPGCVPPGWPSGARTASSTLRPACSCWRSRCSP